MNRTRRRNIDFLQKTVVSSISLTGLLILIFIFSFIFKNGSGLLSWQLLTGNYYPQTYNTYYLGEVGLTTFEEPEHLDSNSFFSKKWGIAFQDETDFEGKPLILITYVDTASLLSHMPDKNNENQFQTISAGQSLDKVIFTNNTIVLSRLGAENAAKAFDQADGIKDMLTSLPGSGIRGSILTTIWLIGLTLMIALPIGIFSAVYLHEFAPKNKWYVLMLRRFIEMLTGVPSIVFGLLGAAVFIPFTSLLTNASGGNLISGALTLAVIVLPVIIAATEEALRNVPDDYRKASLALGATRTQTTFKVVLKTAIPGILSAVLLSVGRIIGESAALIYAVGTAIKDQVIITEKSTSLAVFIWSVMAGETPNFELASAVSLIIMIIVLVLNIAIKLISKKLSFLHNRG